MKKSAARRVFFLCVETFFYRVVFPVARCACNACLVGRGMENTSCPIITTRGGDRTVSALFIALVAVTDDTAVGGPDTFVVCSVFAKSRRPPTGLL